MKKSIHNKLLNLQNRHEEIERLLTDADVIANQVKFRGLSQEYAKNDPIIKVYKEYKQISNVICENEEELKQETGDMAQLIKDEIAENKTKKQVLEKQIQVFLLPKDDRDNSDIYLEIRAGTGGDEAALFAADLFKMYCRFAEEQKWQVEIINSNEASVGGFKEVIAKVMGQSVFSYLKFEKGVHRVQRVPDTESQGRVHTSAATVAILPKIAEVQQEPINPNDLKIDTFRASGAGGQHVNKTDSAIRITHIPTGFVVECQDQRSQHKNKAAAMNLLQAMLQEKKQQESDKERAATRKLQVGSGDRSQRIRTYNYPQNRITDHRINLTIYKLDEVMAGQLSHVIVPLQQEHEAELLLNENY
jgi:peptide chain release factor 1